MRHFVIGTAGHVDHGKTALVKALTGVDTDRLKEEKERGITIELGFASLTLPGGHVCGVVDVPGHERFIRNMVSGVAGIDVVIMVVAADEGVMPQTREHLQICSLLGLRKGLVALTKTDLVDEDWRELVTEDIRTFLRGSFLESSPIVGVSALTGAGLPDLLSALTQMIAEVEEKPDTGLFRLPIDRIFTMKGFGTVVTGTLFSGHIRTGEDVLALPGKIPSRARGIQVHNHSVTQAESGQRTAINLQGVEKAALARGDVLIRPGTLEATRRMDVYFHYLPTNEKKLKNRTVVRFHAGAGEIMARISLLDRQELAPQEAAFAQLFLASPAVVIAGDRFVVRSYSPVTTIGGGIVVDPLTRKHKRHTEQVLRELEKLQYGDEAERILAIVERSSFWGINLKELVIRTGLPSKVVQKKLDVLLAQKQAILLDRDETRVISMRFHQEIQQRLIAQIGAFHEKNPLREGISKEEIRTRIGQFISMRLFNEVIRDLEERGLVTVDREIMRLPDHRVKLYGELDELRQSVALLYRDSGLTPPLLKEVMEKFASRKARVGSVINVMLKDGALIKVAEDMYFDAAALTGLREDYKSMLLRDGKATPSSFRTLTGLSRKYIIPLMEYFDMTKLTVRAGEHRILRDRAH